MSAVRGRRRIPPVAFGETCAPKLAPVSPAGRLRAWLRDLLKQALHEILRRLPVGLAPRLGRLLAPLVQRRNGSRIFARRIAWNLARLHARAPLSEAGHAAALGRWWKGASAVFAEYATVERLRDAGRVDIDDPEGTIAALPADGPVIFACIHLGPFELCFETILNGLGREAVGTWQPEPSNASNAILARLRARYGLFAFPPGQRSARHLHKMAVAEGFDAILFVDEVRDRQVHLPAFGRNLPARGNAVTAVKLALRTGAPLVPVHLLRTGTAHYRFVVGAPLVVEREGEEGHSVPDGVAALDRHFDPLVRAHVEQWYMLPELRLPGFVARPQDDAAAQ
ncbi:lysophospholipid acyltransferase family protein [Stappia sp. MMSF_3263]|uniref:lysophospholipid acyltransferase family protein n=1 Tax=Stappia sp. MMSF_3263 TaxID=3046693 RepID=UPI00273F1DDE|nr:lysophospholipid acyltransferase family protein [Stappia sp. MMSF_3263]